MPIVARMGIADTNGEREHSRGSRAIKEEAPRRSGHHPNKVLEVVTEHMKRPYSGKWHSVVGPKKLFEWYETYMDASHYMERLQVEDN
jgi:hypothetical protein